MPGFPQVERALRARFSIPERQEQHNGLDTRHTTHDTRVVMAQLSSGIIGLPNAGKSTLFNALTRANAEIAAYPFCTIEPNIGVVPLEDPRLDRVASLVDAPQTIYQTVEYVDVAGLVKGASRGEGRGNQFLENVRACQALVHVVRCFDDPNIAHVTVTVDPVEDIRTVDLELVLADLETADRAIEKHRKQARREADAKALVDLLERIRGKLDAETPVRAMGLDEKEYELVRELRFLSDKPVLYAANVGEDALPDMDTPRVRAVLQLAEDEGNAVVPICAKLEQEIAGLESDEARMFLDDAGIEEAGLQRLVRATRRLLGLISFFTFNENETRAWTVPEGTNARRAAGVIHNDFEENFIRAEVTSFADFDAAGGKKGAHDQGLLRIEGRDYMVRDADVIYFRVGP